MRSRLFVVFALASAFLGSQAMAQQDYSSVVADPSRPAVDRERDGARRPAEILAFSGVQPGWRVGEYMPGAGYFTRLLARAVGPEGRVWAYQPSEIVRLRPAYLDEIQAAAAEPGMEHVEVVSEPTAQFGAPEALDLVFTALNYHDLYGPFASEGVGAAFDRAVFEALRPGGVYVVVDHSAIDGTGLTGAGDLHRIERQAVIEAVTAAGFVLDTESDLLRNPEDPRTANVFDESIRGRTDQFVLRFVKPAV